MCTKYISCLFIGICKRTVTNSQMAHSTFDCLHVPQIAIKAFRIIVEVTNE